MISAMGAAATGMEAQLAEIDNISNNLANVNTHGFKRARSEFQDLMYQTLQEPGASSSTLTQSPLGLQRGMGVRLAGTQRNFEVGTPEQTSRNLDLMVRGQGFLMVTLPSGQIGYTRDGAFFKAPNGRVETLDGYPLAPEIYVPTTAQQLHFSEEGTVTAVLNSGERAQLGQLKVATFVNDSGLKAMGQNLFVATDASGPATLNTPGHNSGAILQGFLEGSNVDVVKEMTNMISAQRAYEMNSKVIQTVDQMLQHTVNIR